VSQRTEVLVEGGRKAGQVNPSGYFREPSTSPLLGEVTDSRLPRKTSKLQSRDDRTANRHR
jgi:hypothetical protein